MSFGNLTLLLCKTCGPFFILCMHMALSSRGCKPRKGNRMNLLVQFVISDHSECFEISQIARAVFENFQNITHGHKTQTSLVFIRFPLLLLDPSLKTERF